MGVSVEVKSSKSRASRWPARLDVLQGVSGLALMLFMWVHMLLVSSILISNDAMYAVARFFEGVYFFGEPHYWLVSVVALVIFLLMALHAVIALRKIPSSYVQYWTMVEHTRRMRHPDTVLWLIQVATGFVLMFLASAHIYQVFSNPTEIGPYASADLVWSHNVWPLYLVLMFSVELHGTIGVYRLALKWGWFKAETFEATRRRLRRILWAVITFFILLGLTSLGAYMKLGMEHADRVGERYQPAHSSAEEH